MVQVQQTHIETFNYYFLILTTKANFNLEDKHKMKGEIHKNEV
jgi:hypothetical protein